MVVALQQYQRLTDAISFLPISPWVLLLFSLIPACNGGDGEVVVAHPPKLSFDDDDTDGFDDEDN